MRLCVSCVCVVRVCLSSVSCVCVVRVCRACVSRFLCRAFVYDAAAKGTPVIPIQTCGRLVDASGSTSGAVACRDFGMGSRGVLLPTDHPPPPHTHGTAKTTPPPEPPSRASGSVGRHNVLPLNGRRSPDATCSRPCALWFLLELWFVYRIQAQRPFDR